MATAKKAALLVVLQCSLLNIFGATVGSSELITTAPAATSSTASGYSAGGQISRDGRFVLFQSTAPDLTSSLVGGGVVNLYLADRQQNSVTLISKNAAGIGGANAACVNASMSDDGKFVVFETTATNLVSADIDRGTDIYLRDVAAGTVVRISEPKVGPPAILRAISTNASISGNGERIVFKSGAADLVTPVAGTRIPLFFLYDRIAGTNRAIWSIDLLTGYTTNMTFEPVISKSGTMVCFEATARHLLTRGTTYGRQVYAYDLGANQLHIVTEDVMPILNRAVTTPADHYLRSVSSNGNVVVFLSDVPSSIQSIRTNYLFRHLIAENTTEILATNVNWTTDGLAPFPEVAMSADGQYIAFGIKGNIYRWDATTQTRELVTVATNGNALTITNVSAPIMSADGRYIAFSSAATNIVQGVETTLLPQLYRRDMVTQTTVRVTSEPGGFAATSAQIYDGSISDGGQIVFTSNDPNLIDGDVNAGPDCVIWDESKTPRLGAISKIATNSQSMKPFRFLSLSSGPLSSNGKIVAFSGQLDAVGIAPQIWLRDRTQGITKLVSFEASTGDSYTGASYNAFVSADGRWIAYQTSATNLVSGVTDSNNAVDVIIYDAQAGTNRLVTTAATQASAAVSGGELQAMSLDGRYLAIASASTTVVDPPVTMTGTGTAIYLWDRESGGFRLITRDPNGVGIRGAHTNVVFSPDLRRFAFFASGAVQFTDARTGQLAQAAPGGVTLLIHEIESGVTKGYVATTVTNRVLAFSPDGSKLTTTVLGNSTTRGIWRIDLATGAEEAVTFETGQVKAIESSTGGQHIAFTLDSVPNPFVALLDFPSADTNAIATVNAAYPSRPEINADGSIVIFQNYANAPVFGDTNGYPNPFVYDIATQAVSPIANGDGASVGNILSADGSTLVVLSHASNLVVSDNNNSMDIVAYAISAPPRVYAQVGAAGIDLRFSATASDYVLESANAVDGALGSWQTVTGNQTTEGGSIVVRVSLSDSMRYFRLRKP